MKKFATIFLFGFVIAIGLTFVFDTTTAPVDDQPVSTEPVNILPVNILPVNPPNCGPPGCCPTELAGRYHGRKRTKRFFGRVS